MKKKACFDCGGAMEVFQGVRKGVTYEAYRCTQCRDVTFNMEQAEHYLTAAEKSKEVTFSTWGQSLAIRIPKELAQALHLKPKNKARIIAEKEGFHIIPIPS